MSIKTYLLATGVVLTFATAAGTAYADPYVGELNREQVAVSAQETLVPSSRAAALREEQKIERPSAFGTPGPYYVPSAPFQSGDAHWGPAHDADDE
ncbi:hypothetical protein [Xanthobacter sediminis]|uniref:hypothetical protein n=1 Tax=Xanthobacter sediminis TaxID=3119926 RepID=UPI00372A59A6